MTALDTRALGRRPSPRAVRGRPAPHWAVRAALAAGGLVVVTIWWADTPGTSVAGSGAWLTAAGRVAGLVGAYLVLVQLLLMARLPWFERAVGFDRLAAWHRGLGTNTVLLLATHVLLVVWGYGLTVHHQPVSELFSIITTYPDMWKATIGLLLFVTVGVSSAHRVRRHVSYETWYWLHVTVYVAIALAFFHQTSNGADFVGHPVNKVLWTLLYLGVAACVVVCRVGRPLVLAARHAMVVERVVPEAPGIVSVWIAGRDLDALGAAPGQFLLWRFLAPGHLLTAHPYSLSAPTTARMLRITVKEVGDHSAAVAHLKPGTRVLAEGPFGHFTPAAATRPRVVLIAGGSGIAPIRALAESLSEDGRDVTVVYRASRSADLALAAELDALANAGRITLHWVVGTRRRMGRDPLCAEDLRRAIPDLAERDVFVCGPPGMTLAVGDALRRLGLGPDQVHWEDFSLR